MKKRCLILLVTIILSTSMFGLTVSATESETQAETVQSMETEQSAEMDIKQEIISSIGEQSDAALAEVAQKYNSILQILLTYTDKEGNVYPIQGGSGFLIGGEETGGEYLITANSVITVSDEKKAELCQTYGIEEENITEQIQVAVKRDVVISASVVTNSEEMDIAVLRLGQALHDRTPFVLYDGDMSAYVGKHVTVVGFPVSTAVGQEIVYYTSRDVNIISGSMFGESKIRDEKYIHHSMVPTEGNIGGAILNDEGAVLAVNQSLHDENGYYGLEMDAIMPILDALGIAYRTTSQVAAEEQAALDAIVHKEDLQSAIQAAQALDAKTYTKKSLEGIQPALEEAVVVNEDEEATKEEVNQATETLNTAMLTLELRKPIWWYIALIGGIMLAVTLIIVLILHKTKAKREEKKRKKQEELTVTQPSPAFEAQQNKQDSYRQLVQQSISQSCESTVWNEVVPQQSKAMHNPYVVPHPSEEIGTQVLSADESRQAMANPPIQQQVATLIRVKNGENILINKLQFTLGKERGRCDYCIQDNSAVSRIHAILQQIHNLYYLTDQHATNKTYINGLVLTPDQQYPLHDGDRILLGNEEFIFKV